jgi:peptide chain release factor 2
MRRLSSFMTEIEEWQGLVGQAKSIEDLLTLALEEHDSSLVGSFLDEVAEVTGKLETLEFKLLLSGSYDRRNGIIAIHAGAGGVESQDWAGMLMRMYLRWAERRGYDNDVLDISHGEEGGIKSAMVQISGDYAYGYLKAERGVHRLVRLSPFDADHARHTSFALLEVLPEVEEAVDVSIDPDDLKIDVFRAGGAGGQNVQKNSTAVRITHMPTGVKVSCQNERSQHQNKTIAMRILGARLLELEMRKRSEEVARLKGAHVSAEWGNQIRSYVLHPYKMVKDHRTKFQTSDTDAVLNGDIDGFINAFLSHSVGPGGEVRPDNGAGGSR